MLKKIVKLFIKRDSLLWGLGNALAAQKPVVWLLQNHYRRSRSAIQILVTYACNLKCRNCDILCRQAPSDEHMSIDQIKKFVQESIDTNVPWKEIQILGGEPTLHPDIGTIVRCILEYKKGHAPDCKVVLVTNGYGEQVRKVLANLPKDLVIENTGKKSPVQYFSAINIAPCDLTLYKYADYGKGCGFCHCGMALTPAGYYHCAVSGGMDRVLGFDAGRKNLPAADDSMRDLFKTFCRYCGHFRIKLTQEEIMSPAWLEIFRKYRMKKPELTRY